MVYSMSRTWMEGKRTRERMKKGRLNEFMKDRYETMKEKCKTERHGGSGFHEPIKW